MLNKSITIFSEYITLQQLLKLADVISSGGQAKSFLATNTVVINGINDNRRGRKLRVGDTIVINNEICLTISKEN